jgi:polyphosphate glucokinase
VDFFGIDFGCSSIKYGLVSLDQEITVSHYNALALDQGLTTPDFINALTGLLHKAPRFTALGVGFPSVVRGDHINNMAIEFNQIWAGIQGYLKQLNLPSFALNDADAAGLAEVYRYEASALRQGATLVLTLGTGIGSALFLDGKLLPNTEMGLIELHGIDAELYAAPSVKTRLGLSIPSWAARLQEYLHKVEILLAPDRIVLGGGISSDFEAYRPMLDLQTPLVAAHYRNQAGVIGAALYAAYKTGHYKLVQNQ